jgi:hypothetical protein
LEYIDLKISAQTLNAIGAALQELPYKLSKPAIDEIDRQVRDHLARKVQADDRTKSGEAGDANGDGNGPDGSYTDQDRQA